MNNLQIICFVLSLEFLCSIKSNQNLALNKDDLDNCVNQKNVTECSTIKFKTKNFQCCYYKIESKIKGIKPSSQEMCYPVINPIKPAQDEKLTENGKKVSKEFEGYSLFSAPNILSIDINIVCPDGNLDFNYEAKDFTEEEKIKFKSDTHCLKYINTDAKSENITKEVCYNSILSSVGDSGVSCGYFEFKMNYINGTTSNYKTCFLFNEDIPKTKNMGFWTKQIMELISIMNEEQMKNEISYYQLNASNSKGQFFIYDSSKDSIIDASDSDDAKFLSIKYLVLLILLLILVSM